MAKYKFKVGSVEVIRALVSLPWGKTVEDMYRGGKLLAVTLPKFKEATPLDDEVEVEIDGPERDCIKAGLQHGLDKQMVQPTKYLYELIVAFEFVSIPKPQ